MEVRIEGRIITTALLDTGADVSVMPYWLHQQLNPRPRIYESNSQLSSATDTELQVVGVTQLRLDVNGVEILEPVVVHVVMRCICDLILGRSFIERHVEFIRGNGEVSFNQYDVAHIGETEEFQDEQNFTPISSGMTIELDDDRGSIEIPVEDSNKLTLQEQKSFIRLIKANQDIFASTLGNVGTDLVVHSIPTGNHPPVAVRPYRTPIHLRPKLEAEIESMLTKGVIRESHSPWSAPVVMVAKKDGTVRFCCDYRKLNAITERDQFPMPRITDILDSLSGKPEIFSTMDLLSGFWQVRVDPRDIEKTAFSTESNHYEFLKLPFGLSNSPATFQRLMNAVLEEVKPFCRVYVDDVVVFSCSFNDHINHLEKVFDALRRANLVAKPTKCKFLRQRIAFLGHVVSSNGVEPDPAKTASINEWPAPKTVHELQIWLGMANYYRRFIPGFATTAEPLLSLLRKHRAWRWESKEHAAFESIKLALVQEPILSLPDFNLSFTVSCDASACGLGAVLSQQQLGVERVIAFASKSLSSAQRNYSTTDRECLSIHWALTMWRIYLIGRKFLVITDHAALKWLFSPTRRDPHRRHARLILDLMEYDFEVRHRPGTQHGNADALSRMPELREVADTRVQSVAAITRRAMNKLPPRMQRIDSEWALHPLAADEQLAIELSLQEQQAIEPDITDEEESKQQPDAVDCPVLTDNLDSLESVPRIDLVKAQVDDETLKPMIQFLKSSTLPADERSRAVILRQADLFTIDGAGVLHRISDRSERELSTPPTRLVVPVTLRSLMLRQFHDDSIGGHLGSNKTYERLARRYYWSGMEADVLDYVRSCPVCQRRKSPSNPSTFPTGPPSIPSSPFEKIAIDVLGPLPVTKKGNKFCLCVVDQFTRFPMIFAVPNQRANTVAAVLLERVFLEYGFPAAVLSDRGTNFMSNLFVELLELCRVRKITTLAYNPRANGLVERFNHSLVTMISHFVNKDQKDWDSWLPYVLFAFRSAPQKTFNRSPFYLLYGREPSFPLDLALGARSANSSFIKADDEAYIKDVADRIEEARLVVTHKLEQVRAAREEENAKLKKKAEFDVGEFVMKWRPVIVNPQGKSKKLASQWDGPFEIIDKDVRFNTYDLVALDKQGRKVRSNTSTRCPARRLKAYNDPKDSQFRRSISIDGSATTSSGHTLTSGQQRPQC